MQIAKISLFASFLFASAGLISGAAGQTVPAAPAGVVAMSVATSDSSLTYSIVHKLHKVQGVSKKTEGKARILADGKAQVAVRVPVDTFDSGNVNRDAHVKEVVEAARFPAVEVKATAEGITIPTSFPTTVEKTFTAQVSFHGVQKPVQVPVKLTFESAERLRAQASMTLSLDEYKVERPSLMFVKVDDRMTIDANVVFVLTKG